MEYTRAKGTLNNSGLLQKYTVQEDNYLAEAASFHFYGSGEVGAFRVVEHRVAHDRLEDVCSVSLETLWFTCLAAVKPANPPFFLPRQHIPVSPW